jgi:tRNA A-37 threonylcarbamoyl transferase component Bud32
MIGTVIGNYRVIDTLGAGGMGAVYKAVDVMLEREVALKVLRSELADQPELAERFRTEAIILARLNHPHIATLYGLSREGGRLFMVMEFVPGETLENLLKRQKVVAPTTAARWCCEVLDAMAYAHRRGVVHRDIKPANLMLTEERAVKVMDFGIARVLGSAHQTQFGHVIGTANYMAPEQIRGQEVDGRTDLYALGIVLYQLVTGTTPFAGRNEFAMMAAQVTEAPLPPSARVAAVPAWLDAAILRAMAKSAGDRFQSAMEFRRALESGMRSAPEDDVESPTVAEVPDRPGTPLVLQNAPEAPRPAALVAEPPETPRGGAVPPTRMAGPKPTRMAAPPPPTRLARFAERASLASGGLLDRYGWRAWVGLGAASLVVIAAAVALAVWLASGPASAPARHETSAQGGTAAVPLAGGTDKVSQGSSPSSPPAPQETRVGLPPADSTPAPVGGARPPVVREPSGPADRPRGVAPAPPSAPPQAPVDARPGPDPKGTAAGEPARPAAEPIVFEGVQLLVNASSQVDAVLTLFPDHLAITDEDGAMLKEVRYQSIVGAEYEETHEIKKPSSGAFGALKGALSKGGQLFGAGKHWLSVRTAGEPVVVRLGRSYSDVLPAFERLSGVKVAGR